MKWYDSIGAVESKLSAMELRGGTQTSDPRLDRLVEFDERSRNFPIGAVVPEDVYSKMWYLRRGVRLDQGREGACVGFGWTHELIASPRAVAGLDASFAREKVYWEAQKIDSWPGGAFPGADPQMEGTSVLAGAKIIQRLGYITEYRWAFNIDDVMRALSHEGPVVVGTWWKDSMWSPRPSGLIDNVNGSKVGGHCYLLRGVVLNPRLSGETKLGPCFRLTNSWGADWGLGGDAYIRVDDFEALMNDWGECCVPVGRTSKRREDG